MSEMQVSVENIGHLNRRLSVIVPIKQLDRIKKNRLTTLAKTTTLDGFRRGTLAAAKRIEQLSGDSIWSEVIQEALQSSLSEALKRTILNPAGQPHIDLIKTEPGQNLEYIASFEIYPEVLAPELKGVSLEKLRVDITETDVSEVLEKMRYQHADWIEVKRKAQSGDKVIFDLAPSEGEVRKDLELVLEEGKIPEGFATLLGSAVGETIKISLSDGEQLEKANLATVQVQKIAEPKLAELDDTFAKRLGIQEGGIEALRTELRQHMQSELDRVLRGKLKAQVIDKLLEMNEVEELPQVLLDQEFQRLEKEWQGNGKSAETPLSEKAKTEVLFTAKRRVILGLLFRALIEKYHLHVDENRVYKELARLANTFQFEQAALDKLFKDKNMMLNIRSSVLEEQVLDKLLEEAEYTEKVASYSEIMNFGKKMEKNDTREEASI